jgi:hypothetical protein
LIECVNDTLSTELLTRASGGRPDLVAVPAGRPHIVLVTRATENVYSYASLSLFLQASYAAVHNYTLYPLVPDTAEVDYRYYRKLAPLLQVLRECSQWAPRPCDYVVWMDAGAYQVCVCVCVCARAGLYWANNCTAVISSDICRRSSLYAHGALCVLCWSLFLCLLYDLLNIAVTDAVIADRGFTFESLVAGHPGAHLITAADASTGTNSGVLLVRNSPWAVFLLEAWKHHAIGSLTFGGAAPTAPDEAPAPAVYTDQEGFDVFYRLLSPQSRSRVVILPAAAINTVLPAMLTWVNSSPVLHLAAESDAYRRAVFAGMAAELCVHTASAAQRSSLAAGPDPNPNPNPAVSRKFSFSVNATSLLRVGVEVYAQSFAADACAVQRLQRRLRGLGQGLLGGEAAGLGDAGELLAALRRSGSKYAFSLSYTAAARQTAPPPPASAQQQSQSQSQQQQRARERETPQSLGVRLLLVRQFHSVVSLMATAVMESPHGPVAAQRPRVAAGLRRLHAELNSFGSASAAAAAADALTSLLGHCDLDGSAPEDGSEVDALQQLFTRLPEATKLSLQLTQELYAALQLLSAAGRDGAATDGALQLVSGVSGLREAAVRVIHAHFAALRAVTAAGQQALVQQMEADFNRFHLQHGGAPA